MVCQEIRTRKVHHHRLSDPLFELQGPDMIQLPRCIGALLNPFVGFFRQPSRAGTTRERILCQRENGGGKNSLGSLL